MLNDWSYGRFTFGHLKSDHQECTEFHCQATDLALVQLLVSVDRWFQFHCCLTNQLVSTCPHRRWRIPSSQWCYSACPRRKWWIPNYLWCYSVCVMSPWCPHRKWWIPNYLWCYSAFLKFYLIEFRILLSIKNLNYRKPMATKSKWKEKNKNCKNTRHREKSLKNEWRRKIFAEFIKDQWIIE